MNIEAYKNPYRISVSSLAKDYEYTLTEFIESVCYDSIIPACCKAGCEIEPDGVCEHGCPSPLRALNLI